MMATTSPRRDRRSSRGCGCRSGSCSVPSCSGSRSRRRATLAIGTAVAIGGECLRVWASGHLNKARDVTASGPYRWFAHPLYVGSSIMGVGLAVIANHVVVTALIAFYLVVTLSAAISSEEAFLRRTFGDRYDRYRRGDRSRQ